MNHWLIYLWIFVFFFFPCSLWCALLICFFCFWTSTFFLQITEFLDSHGFLDYIERGVGSDENSINLLDKLQDAIGRGQNPYSILPSFMEPEIITISDQDVGTSGILVLIFNIAYYACSCVELTSIVKLITFFMVLFVFLLSLVLQEQVPNILMIGFLLTLDQKNKKRKGSRFLQLQVEHLNTLSMLLGMFFLYVLLFTTSCWTGYFADSNM